MFFAGPGEGIEHLFYYPEQAQENYVVNQYVNADAGAKGLAEIVKEISDAAIKVRASFWKLPASGSCHILEKRTSSECMYVSVNWHLCMKDFQVPKANESPLRSSRLSENFCS